MPSPALDSGTGPRGGAAWAKRGAGTLVAALLVWGLASAMPHPELQIVGLTLTRVMSGLEEPVAAVAQPGTTRVFVAERTGRVRIIEDQALVEEPAIDLRGRVAIASWEQGLVGLALHPDFAANGRVFLSYTDAATLDQVVSEFRAYEPGGTRFDPESEVELLRVSQSSLVHKGGSLRFDEDGLLWVGFGDGGPLIVDGFEVQDPLGHGQNPHTLQATMVRIDVDSGSPYGIPADNPFVQGEEGAPEVWAFGLRNPWSFTFDDGRLFIADVGEAAWEEVDIVSLADGAGSNFGWSLWEGPGCFADRPCDQVDAVFPALAVSHAEACAIVGGPVYRGTAIPELVGQYLYADFCSGWLRSVALAGTHPYAETVRLEPEESVPQVTALFTDGEGEVYLLTLAGDIFRLDPVR